MADTKQDKVKKAAHMVLFKRGRRPGARDWELRQRVGKDWEEHLKGLGEALAPLDLEVKRVEEPSLAEGAEPPVRYVAVLKGTLTPTDARMLGWRIDHLAGLAAALGLVLAKQGRAPRDEVEDLLASRLGRWRASTALDSYVRQGYLHEDDDGLLAPDWRTAAEVDLRALMGRLLAMKPEAGPEGGDGAGRGSGKGRGPADEDDDPDEDDA